MPAAVLAVVAILVGLPLLAWWIGGRRFWGRLRPGAERDRSGDALRRHGVTGADAARVITAVGEGRRLDSARLRRAAVDLATVELAQYPRWGRSLSRRARIAVRGSLLAAMAGLIALELAVLDGDPMVVLWEVVYGSIFGAVRVRRRVLERAVRVNGDPDAPPGDPDP